MIIENLITGIAEGWFNSKGKHSTLPFSERHDIEHKNLVLRNPQFEKNNKVDLNQFKIKPFIFLENQDVIIYDKRTKYQLKLDKVVIKNVSIVDASKNIEGEIFTKFKGEFYSKIEYFVEDVKKNKIISNTLIKNEKKLKSTTLIQKVEVKEDTGCFNLSGTNMQEKQNGCFSSKSNVKKFYDLNYTDFKSKINDSRNASANYWKSQAQRSSGIDNNNSPLKEKNGKKQINYFMLIITLIGAYLMIIQKINISNSIIFGLLMFIATIIFYFMKPLSLLSSSSFLRGLLFFSAIPIILLSLSLSSSLVDDYDYDRDKNEEIEIVEIPETNENDSVISQKKLIKIPHKWDDLNSNSYSENFITPVEEYLSSKKFLNNLNLNYFGDSFEIYWGQLYKEIISHELKKNNENQLMFESLTKINDKEITQHERLEGIISSIQNIPYYLIHEESCQKSAIQSEFSRDYHMNNEPCVSNAKYGIALPSQFSGNFKGDCDTRALYLYLILKRMGYDVAVLVSNKYAHAVLGINIQGSGKFVKFKGKRYLTVETTSPGWKIGQLPPESNNTRYWRVALN